MGYWWDFDPDGNEIRNFFDPYTTFSLRLCDPCTIFTPGWTSVWRLFICFVAWRVCRKVCEVNLLEIVEWCVRPQECRSPVFLWVAISWFGLWVFFGFEIRRNLEGIEVLVVCWNNLVRVWPDFWYECLNIIVCLFGYIFGNLQWCGPHISARVSST